MNSNIMEDGNIGRNIYDFVLVLYNNFDRISYRFYVWYQLYQALILLTLALFREPLCLRSS